MGDEAFVIGKSDGGVSLRLVGRLDLLGGKFAVGRNGGMAMQIGFVTTIYPEISAPWVTSRLVEPDSIML